MEILDPKVLPSPPSSRDDLEEWLKDYLSPGNGQPHRAHKFICNVLTYPLVRDMHFAATPHPPHVTKSTGEIEIKNRTLSLIAGLHATRPGDIIFFHQSERMGEDEELKDYFGYKREAQAKRGAVGVYRILSTPFSDSKDMIHPQTNYRIAGSCPICDTKFALMKGLNDYQVSTLRDHKGDTIPAEGEIENEWCPGSVLYSGQKNHSNDHIHSGSLTLSNRLILEPIAIFPDSVGDNRLYMDFSDEDVFWTGRTDSKMGAGKGSTTRQILPEEAAKLVRLLIDEARGPVKKPDREEYPTPEENLEKMKDHNLAPYDELFMVDEEESELANEFYLNVYFALKVDKNSSLQRTLSDVYNTKHLEYFSSEYPLGAAGDESDFLITFKKSPTEARYRALHFEFKKGELTNEHLAELMLYVPWIAQACTQFSDPEVEEFEIIPILVGNDKSETLKSTEEYSFEEEYLVGSKKNITVRSSRVLLYSPTQIVEKGNSKYTKDLEFEEVTGGCEKTNWPHSSLKYLSKSDLDWVLKEEKVLDPLMMVDGVGKSTNENILEHFGNLQSVVGATKEELMKASGVGPSTAEEIMEFLDNKSDDIDSIPEGDCDQKGVNDWVEHK